MECTSWLFSSFQCHFKGSSKAGAGQSNRRSSDPQMASTSMVFNGNEDADQPSCSFTAQYQAITITQPPTKGAPTIQETGYKVCHL